MTIMQKSSHNLCNELRVSREIREQLTKINRRPRSSELRVCRVAPIELVTVDAVGIRRFYRAQFCFLSRALSRSLETILAGEDSRVERRPMAGEALKGPIKKVADIGSVLSLGHCAGATNSQRPWASSAAFAAASAAFLSA